MCVTVSSFGRQNLICDGLYKTTLRWRAAFSSCQRNVINHRQKSVLIEDETLSFSSDTEHGSDFPLAFLGLFKASRGRHKHERRFMC